MKSKTKNLLLFALISVFLVGSTGLSAKRIQISAKERREAVKNLSESHKYWYDMVTYIATQEEKDVFLKLANERDRDIFIRTFWQQRDPTPGTPENEYKNEIQNRFVYATERFRRGAGRPGWMTDMGRFYMILGKPNSEERFESEAGLYPARVWYYYGDKRLGLPTYFCVTFYRPQNQTEWKLYNPSIDGPAALLINQQPVDREDYASLYSKIYELAPTLAMPAISMLPNQDSELMGRSLSMRSSIILSNIYESPKREINVSYATNFLNYKGFVDVDASVNFIENTHLVSVNRYGRFPFSFITLSVKPKEISVGYSEEKDQYYFNFELSVSLKKGERFVHQYSKNFDFYIDPDDVDRLRGNGIVLHDAFPVIPGEYTLMVFVKNTVGKEFTYLDTDVKIPPVSNLTVLSKPVLGYKAEDQADPFFYPYKVQNQKLFVDTDGTLRLREQPTLWFGVYNLKRALWETGRVEIDVHGMNERTKYSKTHVTKLNDRPFEENLNVFYPLSDEGFPPDYYDYEVRLIDGAGVVIDKASGNFTVSPLRDVAYPMETFKRSRIDNPYHFYHVMASQYEKMGQMDPAETYYEQCVEANPDFAPGRVSLLNLLNQRKRYTQVLVEVEKLKQNREYKFEYHLIKGTALYGMKEYDRALDELLEANNVYNSDVRVLNLLGFTLGQLRNFPEALKAFEASLNLDQDQPLIKKVHADLQKRVAGPETGKSDG